MTKHPVISRDAVSSNIKVMKGETRVEYNARHAKYMKEKRAALSAADEVKETLK